MIEIQNISKSFGEKEVLKDFNLSIDEGETIFILGESGRGKTTLIRILLGLEKMDNGTIEGLSDKKLSVVFQEDRLLESLSILSNLKMILNINSNKKEKITYSNYKANTISPNLEKKSKRDVFYSNSNKDIINSREIIHKMAEIGLNQSLDTNISELSGGMKRRISILRAILVNFDLILMDEPFKGLDKETKSKVMDFVIKNTNKKMSLIVTHDYSEVEYFKKKVDNKRAEKIKIFRF